MKPISLLPIIQRQWSSELTDVSRALQFCKLLPGCVAGEAAFLGPQFYSLALKLIPGNSA